jgi:4-hydroxy-3-methylbut-2-en-1-yl diphosphate reductase
MTSAVVCTPLRSERAALWHAVSASVVRTGRGPARRLDATGPVLVAGVAGALTDDLRPGDIVVADQLRTADAVIGSFSATLVFGALRRLGLTVRLGALLSEPRVIYRDGRKTAAASGAVAVDTESAYLARQAPAGLTVAVRSIVDTPDAPLLRPGTVWRGVRALRALRAAGPAIDQWAAATGDRRLVATDAPDSDLVLGLGCDLRPEKYRCPAYLVGEITELDLRWLARARRIAIATGPSTPPRLTEEVIRALSGLGHVFLDDAVSFTMPEEMT